MTMRYAKRIGSDNKSTMYGDVGKGLLAADDWDAATALALTKRNDWAMRASTLSAVVPLIGRIRKSSGIALRMTVISLLALSGCERWTLDRQMEELCKKDGGVKVYEKVTLPASDFTNVGEPLGRYWKSGTPQDERLGPDYKYVVTEEFLVGKQVKTSTGEGELRRIHEAIYRRSDNRLLGESIWYSRGGGDGFTFGYQPSGNACPLPSTDLARSTFLRGN